jgi:hypothetical protein
MVLCASVAFYKQVAELAEELEAMGLTAIVPATVRTMAETGNYDVASHKSWYQNDADYDQKADLMRQHFDEVANGDSILVVNHEKHGKANYIGPNVLMEMSLAFYLKKPIYILNELPDETPFEEEIKGMQPLVLHGDTSQLSELVKR